MQISKLTKIIATIGPSSEDPETIEKLIESGVDIFRFNMKHNTPQWHLDRINSVQKIADKLKKHIGIMIDLQGPEIRIETRNEKEIKLKEGDEIVFSDSFKAGRSGNKVVRVPHKIVLESIKKGNSFAIQDGFYQFEVVDKPKKNIVVAKILTDGVIKNRKSLNLIGKDVGLPSLIDSDLVKLDLASKAKVDFVALSFVRTTKDIKILKKEIKKRDLNVKVISKIETQKGLNNINKLIDISDGIMIARGDLGVETPIEKLNYYQKEIIKKCRSKAKAVIVATQMLASMTENPYPTRAEAADVANAAFDQTDCVMLSEETAMGKYPVRAVKFMSKILKFNENLGSTEFTPEVPDQTHSFVRAGLEILREGSGTVVDKILVITDTGKTAKTISSYRPDKPVFMISNLKKTIETLSINYGLIPVYMENVHRGSFVRPKTIISFLEKSGYVKKGERVLLFHRTHTKQTGSTNQLILLEV